MPETKKTLNHLPTTSAMIHHPLCRSSLLESSREPLHVVREVTPVAEELNVSTIGQQLSSHSLLDVLLPPERRETPLLADNDLLATRELVLRAAESLDGSGAVSVTSADGEENLTNVDTGNGAVGLSPGTTHTGLQSIGTSARQHLVDADDVEGVGADTHVETFLSSDLDKVPESFVNFFPFLN